jgi:hypothetical protein
LLFNLTLFWGAGHLGARQMGAEPFGRKGHLGARLLITKYKRNKNFKKYKASKIFIFC